MSPDQAGSSVRSDADAGSYSALPSANSCAVPLVRCEVLAWESTRCFLLPASVVYITKKSASRQAQQYTGVIPTTHKRLKVRVGT